MLRSHRLPRVAAILALTAMGPQRVSGQASPPSLELTRDLRIDAAEQDLSPIGWMLVSRAGAIAVAQPQDNLVRWFDARGATLGTFGRAGAGPGEFQSLGFHGWAGDTMWVSDMSTRRVTFIGPDRALAATVPFPTALTADDPTRGPLPTVTFIVPRAVHRDGSLLVTALLGRGQDWAAWARPADKDATPLFRVTRDGVVERVVTWSPSGRCSASVQFPGGFGAVAIPFCASPILTVSDDGDAVALAMMENAEGSTGQYTVTLLRSSGDTVFSRRYEYTPRAIPQRVADSVIELRSRRQRGAFLEAYHSMKVPPTYPPLNSMLLGRDGTVWLEMYADGASRPWTVLDRRGTPVGRADVPRNVTLRVAALDAVWGVETDEDGLQSIVRYKVTRRR